MEPSGPSVKLSKTQKKKTLAAIVKTEAFQKVLSERFISPETGIFFKMIQKEDDNNYVCLLCRCSLKTREVIQHVSGKRHAISLEILKENEEIYKGKPLPPGVRNKPRLRVQKNLDKIKEDPVIGVEYILELSEKKAYFTNFFCALCYMEGDSDLIASHLLHNSHKFMYLKSHFPTALGHITTDEGKSVLPQYIPVLDKVVRAIQATYGRLKHTVVKSVAFENNKVKFIDKLHRKKHFSEADGETFENLVIKEVSKETEPKNNENLKEVVGTVETVTHTDRKIDDYGNKLEVFNKLSEDIDDEMNEIVLTHRENPEDHPQYNKEWQKFREERCVDLRSRGEDCSTYDFKQEWKDFWDYRMRELHFEKTKSKKTVLKRMLGLQDEPMPLSNFNNDQEVILVDEDSSDSRNSSKRKTGSRSPIIIDDSSSCSSCKDGRYSEFPGRNPIEKQDKSDEMSGSKGKSSEIVQEKERREHRDSKENIVYKDEIDMVALLRILAGLEEYLGSLGPEVIDFLSSALTMESRITKSSKELLYNEKNCLLLQIVREKLKGQIQVGLVTGLEEKVFRTAIKDIETAIQASRQRIGQTKEKSSKNLTIITGVGAVDTENVVRQFINALIAAGKKDITQEQLNEMLRVLVRTKYA